MMARAGFILLCILGSIFVRLQYLDLPLERDEGEYAYIAWRFNEGTAPYLSAYTMKFPLVHLLYALSFKLLGTSAESARLLLMVVNLASGLLLYSISKRYWNERIALLSGGLFLLYSLLPTLHGLSANTEHFVNFFVLAAFAIFVTSQNKGPILMTGAFLGLAILSKQTAAAFALMPLLLLAKSSSGSHRRLEWLATRSGCLVIGIALPLILICLAALGNGSADAMLFWVARYPLAYTSQIPMWDGLLHFGKVAESLLLTTGVTPALLVAVGLFTRRGRPEPRRFVLLFLACSVIAVIPGFYFRPHYFILTIPPISLLAALGLNSLYESMPQTNRLLRLQSMMLCALLVAAPVAVNTIVFKGLTSSEFMKLLYRGNPFHHSAEIAAIIRENSSARDSIAVLGSEPQMYFYSGRPSATRYIYTYSLTEDHSYQKELHAEFVEDIVTNSPRIIVVVNYLSSWNAIPSAANGMVEEVNDYIDKNYEPIYSIDYDSVKSQSRNNKKFINVEQNVSEVIVLKRISS